MRTWADVAVLAKVKNLEGGFLVRSTEGLPFLLQEGLEVAFVPPVLDAPRRARVSKVTQQKNEALVFFEGIENRDLAESLCGCHCLVRRDLLPQEALSPLGFSLEGWMAKDETANFSAKVIGVRENPGQSLLELENEEGRLVLVPLVDDFIAGLDEEAQLIKLSAPAGLYTLD